MQAMNGKTPLRSRESARDTRNVVNFGDGEDIGGSRRLSRSGYGRIEAVSIRRGPMSGARFNSGRNGYRTLLGE